MFAFLLLLCYFAKLFLQEKYLLKKCNVLIIKFLDNKFPIVI